MKIEIFEKYVEQIEFDHIEDLLDAIEKYFPRTGKIRKEISKADKSVLPRGNYSSGVHN